MNIEASNEYASKLIKYINSSNFDKYNNKITIFPPFTLLPLLKTTFINTPIMLGAQNCSSAENGPFTGEISAAMLKEAGCRYVILGHSERRAQHKELSEIVQKKAESAHKLGLKTVICIGESEDEFNSRLTNTVLEKQLIHSMPKTANNENTVIAYEPTWAIGTGKTPTMQNIIDAFKVIKKILKSFSFEKLPSILYGGSVNSDNAKGILSIESVDGLLIGGSSLDPIEFTKILSNTKNV